MVARLIAALLLLAVFVLAGFEVDALGEGVAVEELLEGAVDFGLRVGRGVAGFGELADGAAAALGPMAEVSPCVALSAVSASEGIVILSGRGRIFVSSRPTGGASTWHATATGQDFTTISCPSARLCVLGTSAGTIVIGRRR